MRLGVEILFDDFFKDLEINKKTYLLLYNSLTRNNIVFKCKPNDIWTNVFNIQAQSLWQVNINT
jgi:hypothetical protein